MIRGWFIGNFEPSVYKTSEVEVAIKQYIAGATEGVHHHKIATEVTVIVTGKVRMNDREYSAGEIIRIEPNEETDFEALTDTITAVVKIPGVMNDKYKERKNA